MVTFTADDIATAVETNTMIEEPTEQLVEETIVETKQPIIEEKAEEKKVEEVKEEVKQEEKKEEVNIEEKPVSVFDRFKPKEEKKVEETKAVEIPDTVKAELENAKQEIARLTGENEKYKTPLAKLLGGDYDLTKVDIKALAKQMAGTDYSVMSDEALIEASLKANPSFEQLTTEEKEEEVERLKTKFSDMSKLEVLTERRAIISKIDQTDPNDILNALTEIQSGQKNLVDPEKFFQEKSAETFNNKFSEVKAIISETAKSLVGQKYGEYTTTAEDAVAIEAAFEDQTLKFDPEKTAFNLFKSTTYDAYGKFEYDRGLAEGIKQKTNASVNKTTSTPVFKEGDKSTLESMKPEQFFDIR